MSCVMGCASTKALAAPQVLPATPADHIGQDALLLPGEALSERRRVMMGEGELQRPGM